MSKSTLHRGDDARKFQGGHNSYSDGVITDPDKVSRYFVKLPDGSLQSEDAVRHEGHWYNVHKLPGGAYGIRWRLDGFDADGTALTQLNSND